jgi:hypothetical protein
MQQEREEYKCIIKHERKRSLGSLKHGCKDNIIRVLPRFIWLRIGTNGRLLYGNEL